RRLVRASSSGQMSWLLKERFQAEFPLFSRYNDPAVFAHDALAGFQSTHAAHPLRRTVVLRPLVALHLRKVRQTHQGSKSYPFAIQIPATLPMLACSMLARQRNLLADMQSRPSCYGP